MNCHFSILMATSYTLYSVQGTIVAIATVLYTVR